MFRRSFFLLVMLGAAVTVPFTMSENKLSNTAKQKWKAWFGDKGDIQTSAVVSPGVTNTDASQPPVWSHQTVDMAAYDGPVSDLREVIRFDIDPQWVTSRWSRVSTTLAESNLQGLRVALVSGTEVDDVTGSLTYYFNKQHEVQRITLHGHTGNDRKLKALVKEHFGFNEQPTLGAGLYMSRWNGKATSLLRLSHSPVVRANSPHTRLQVMLEINRPGAYYGLSEESKLLLDGDGDRQARRW